MAISNRRLKISDFVLTPSASDRFAVGRLRRRRTDGRTDGHALQNQPRIKSDFCIKFHWISLKLLFPLQSRSPKRGTSTEKGLEDS